MAVKLQVPKNSIFSKLIRARWGRGLLAVATLISVVCLSVFIYFYVKYAKLIEEKLAAGTYNNSTVLYSSPRPLNVGDEADPDEIAGYLKQAGYSESNTSRVGWFQLRTDAIEINPGPDAYEQEGAVIKISKKHVTGITSLPDHSQRTKYLLEPEMISNLFDSRRQKRRLVHFEDVPQVMVNALTSAEDKHFFEHAGFDPVGIVRAIWIDVRTGQGSQGASTISQQLARMLLLDDTQRGWRRKLPETLITLNLEQKLTKQQIFEYYINDIYLGSQGSFRIHGLGEGAQVYLGKDLKQVTLTEAALLAGLINSPQKREPFRHPEKAIERRNMVLKSMRENGHLTDPQLTEAVAAPLTVKVGAVETSDAPYFVDVVDDTLQNQFKDYDFQNTPYRVYTSLDMNLQRDAVEAIRVGIQETDAQWKKRNKKYGTDEFPSAQACVIALDTETGKILAMAGGRSYGVSQLNHCLAKRQPGSSFKPFVYTAAMMTAIDPEGGEVLTPATTVVDEPTTFWFGDEPYEPKNHGEHYNGEVTLRRALAMSLNIPAVKIAEKVGYNKVASVARQAGLNITAKGTPSMALGAYEVTPLDIATAYTVFPNGGNLLKNSVVDAIRDHNGASIYQGKVDKKLVLDPRVTYLVESMMEEVLRSGTGGGVWSRGFNLPAAGKTGTSRDGWFAGFTSRIVAVVWVGFDDNRDFVLEGARSALPIWTEFMNRAHKHREYRNVHGFDPPEGIVTAEIDAETGELATSACPKKKTEVFIAGTQPVTACRMHSGGHTQISGWDPVQTTEEVIRPVLAENKPVAEASPAKAEKKKSTRAPKSVIPVGPSQDAQPHAPAKPPESKGVFGRLRDLFR